MVKLTLMFVLVGGQAALACPKEMGETGIVLTRTSPFFSIYVSDTERGLTEQRIMVRGAAPENVSSVYPHPLVIGQRAGGDGVLSLTYAKPTSQLDRLDRIGHWTSDVVLRSGQTPVGTGKATLSFLGDATISIGTCTYDVWHVEDRLELESRAPIIFDKFYSPALGVVLKTVKLTQKREPIDMVEFNEIAVGSTF